MGKIRKALGRRLQRLRKLSGMTQEGLAEKAGLSWSHVNAIEGGRKSASLEAIEILSNALGVPPKDLFDFPWPTSAKTPQDASTRVYEMLQQHPPEDALVVSEIVQRIFKVGKRS